MILQNLASASADLSPLAQSPTSYAYRMLTGSCVPIVVLGVKVLGVPLGDAPFCAQQDSNTVLSIQSDLDLLSRFENRHQRTKLAVYCCNTRITYLTSYVLFPSRAPSHLDALFDHFMAVSLSFQDDYAHSPHATHYAQALQQIRQLRHS